MVTLFREGDHLSRFQVLPEQNDDVSGARRWLAVAAILCAADGGKAWAVPCRGGPLARRPAFPVRPALDLQSGRLRPPAVCER